MKAAALRATLFGLLIMGGAFVGQPNAAATETSSPQDLGPAGALTTPEPSRVPIPLTSKVIYKGYTIEEIAADAKLLEEILSQADYVAPGGVRINEKGVVDPPVADGNTDAACPNKEECP